MSTARMFADSFSMSVFELRKRAESVVLLTDMGLQFDTSQIYVCFYMKMYLEYNIYNTFSTWQSQYNTYFLKMKYYYL